MKSENKQKKMSSSFKSPHMCNVHECIILYVYIGCRWFEANWIGTLIAPIHSQSHEIDAQRNVTQSFFKSIFNKRGRLKGQRALGQFISMSRWMHKTKKKKRDKNKMNTSTIYNL